VKKSNKFLKVTGILMIIGGSFAVLGGIVILIFGVLFLAGNIHNPEEITHEISRFFQTSIWITVSGGIIQFITGIMGVKNAGNPKHANICLLFGSLTALCYIVSHILRTSGGNSVSHYDAIAVVIGMIIPALYLIGAVQMKRVEEAQEAEEAQKVENEPENNEE